ncbi:hypothetical protein PFWH6_3409 [Pseudomonas fluorescens WH6]|nr:hypothetical protein PFWH6_3409 [Pseudomonas fluorescens WH6]
MLDERARQKNARLIIIGGRSGVTGAARRAPADIGET